MPWGITLHCVIVFEIPDFLKWTYSLLSPQPHKVLVFYSRRMKCLKWTVSINRALNWASGGHQCCSLLLTCLMTWDKEFSCPVSSTWLWISFLTHPALTFWGADHFLLCVCMKPTALGCPPMSNWKWGPVWGWGDSRRYLSQGVKHSK